MWTKRANSTAIKRFKTCFLIFCNVWKKYKLDFFFSHLTFDSTHSSFESNQFNTVNSFSVNKDSTARFLGADCKLPQLLLGNIYTNATSEDNYKVLISLSNTLPSHCGAKPNLKVLMLCIISECAVHVVNWTENVLILIQQVFRVCRNWDLRSTSCAASLACLPPPRRRKASWLQWNLTTWKTTNWPTLPMPL